MTQVGADGDVGILVASSTIFSLGLAPIFTLTNDLILGAAPPERAGAASAISETGAELGGALSIAVLGTLGTAVYRSRVTDDIPAGIPPEQAAVAEDTLGGAVAVGEELPVTLAEELLGVAREAFVVAMQVSAGVSAVVALGTAIVAVAFMRGVRGHAHVESADEPVPARPRCPVPSWATSIEGGEEGAT